MNITRTAKVALASRRLFRNWLWAGMKYYLYRHGILHTDKVEVTCRDGFRYVLPVGIYGVLLNAYYDGVISYISCRGGIVKFANGYEVPMAEVNPPINILADALARGWRFDGGHGYWFKGNIRFRHFYESIYWLFEQGEYKDVNAEGKVVIDIGAFVGDSPIYFALRGASRVIAVEPHPGAFKEMLENIRLNNLESKVIPINAGLAGRRGRVCLRDVSTTLTGYVYHEPGNCEDGIEALTLNEILSKYVGSGNKPLLLKMDCEGCEYDVVLNDYESVRKFDEIIFEYHAYTVKKSVKELLNILNKDFKCHKIRGNDEIGIIKCARRSQ